jgi:hypothetical protein
MSEARMKFTTQGFGRGQLRLYLDKCKYKGFIDKWEESKHFFNSYFYVYGKLETLKLISDDLQSQLRN